MKHMRMMWGCVAVIAVIVVVAVSGFDLPGWARLVVLAACPVMMIAMVVMMGRGRAGDRREPPAGATAATSNERDRA
jgi:choline-glycine betaine transporter